MAAALPRGGAVALRSAAIQQQRLTGAEHHSGGLCAAERRPLSPVYAYRDSRTQLEKAIVAYIDYYYYRRIK